MVSRHSSQEIYTKIQRDEPEGAAEEVVEKAKVEKKQKPKKGKAEKEDE